MKPAFFLTRRPFLSSLLCAASLFAFHGNAAAQNTKGKAKPAVAAKKPAAKPAVKAAAGTELSKHVAANIKFLNVLSRYADALNAAKDAVTAGLAAAQIEVITKDAIIAGEELAKLGRPSPELEAKIAADKELAAVAARVAESTQAAVTSLAANEEVKPIVAASIENFQAALNRIQQFAEDPHSAPSPAQPAPAEATAAAPGTPAGQ
jgi:hypothetical protein